MGCDIGSYTDPVGVAFFEDGFFEPILKAYFDDSTKLIRFNTLSGMYVYTERLVDIPSDLSTTGYFLRKETGFYKYDPNLVPVDGSDFDSKDIYVPVDIEKIVFFEKYGDVIRHAVKIGEV